MLEPNPVADQMASRLAHRVPEASEVAPGRRVVAVEGRSGAGKTDLAARLGEALLVTGRRVTVVSMDELYPGWDGLEAGVRLLLDGVLRPYARGEPQVTVRQWDWTANQPGEVDHRLAAPVLVVEGVGCGARACAPYLSLLVWVDAPDDVRRQRALARDGATFAPHWDRWALQELAHYDRESTRERAQAVVVVP